MSNFAALVDLIPEAVLLGGALVCCTVAAISRRATVRVYQGIVGVTLLGTTISALVYLRNMPRDGYVAYSDAIVVDRYAVFLVPTLCAFTLFTVLAGDSLEDRIRPHLGEYHALLLAATLGAVLLVSAREMIAFYIALELLSVSLYVLVGIVKTDARGSEAAFKYLIIGAASSAVLLYGLAILYGLTGRTDLYAVAQEIAAQGGNSPALMLATVFVIGGLSFKIAAVPFHQWVPDVYQGSPTPVTAFVSVSSKAAGYALLVRVLTSALLPVAPRWGVYLAITAALTMTVGNVSALGQTSLKRLLGYSSIAQAGYLMLGLVALSAGGDAARVGLTGLLFYLLVYGLTNLAAFAAVEAAEAGLGGDDVAVYAGLAQRAPGLALILSLCLVSLTGIPPLIGFFAKLFVFTAAIQAGYPWLVVVALANSALSSVYYLRFVRAMYYDEGRETRRFSVPWSIWAVLGIGVVAMLPLVLIGGQALSLAQKAAAAILR
jgi:NADH-quinone oxidoreductase subunit N